MVFGGQSILLGRYLGVKLVQSRKEFCKISYSREAETCKISYSTLDHDYDEIDQEGLGGNPVYL